MKIKDLKELHTKTRIELLKMAQELGFEISKLSMEMKMKKVKNLNEVRTKMKNRARILTIAHMKGEER